MSKKKSGKIVLYISLVLLLILVITPVYFLFVPLNLNSGAGSIAIDVKKGMSVNDIAKELKAKGIIRSVLAFKVSAFLRGRKLQAGEYEFTANMSAWKITGILRYGLIKLYKITVPEGFTSDQIASEIEERGLGKARVFLQVVAGEIPQNKKLIIPGKKNMEGYLFPDTYYFKKGVTEYDIADAMYKRFKAVDLRYELSATCKEMNLKFNYMLTLASIVEKEAEKPEERPMIAAVFINRLRRNWRLESCATIYYALGAKKDRNKNLTTKNLQVDSPYNTYLHQGLPPAPISNPGVASMMAVIKPGELKYLYFVSKGDGTHEFTKTLEEHNKAKKKYKQ